MSEAIPVLSIDCKQCGKTHRLPVSLFDPEGPSAEYLAESAAWALCFHRMTGGERCEIVMNLAVSVADAISNKSISSRMKVDFIAMTLDIAAQVGLIVGMEKVCERCPGNAPLSARIN